MDYVFIDTSVFESENFLMGNKINSLFSLAQSDEIIILLPQLTYEEIKNRIRKRCKESFEYLKENKYLVLKNAKLHNALFNLKSLNDTLYEIYNKLDKQITRSKIKKLTYDNIDIESIFKSYFAQEKPFGSGQKKDEFPDAVALQIVENWCKKYNKKCILLSNDKDMKEFESDVLIHEDTEKYVNRKLKEAEDRTKDINKLFINNESDYIAEIKEWCEKQLDDESLYLNLINYAEIEYIDIVDLTVSFKDYFITRKFDDNIQIQAYYSIYYKVRVEHSDLDSGFYDDEEKIWYYLENTFSTFEESDNIPIDFEYRTFPNGEASLDIIKINNGNKMKI